MNHINTTPPATEPISLAEMRLHLGINRTDDTSRDFIMTGRITSARQWCEAYTRTAYITQTWKAYSDQFPGSTNSNSITFPNYQFGGRIALKMPLTSVTSIKYLDNNGVQTLNPSQYVVDLVTGYVVPAYGLYWPSARQIINSVQIDYVCGYSTDSAVPEGIKDAIRFIVGQWEGFQSSMEGVMRPFTIPYAAKQLLDFYIDRRDYF